MIEVINVGEEAIFQLLDEDLSNALMSLGLRTNKRAYKDLINKKLSKKMRRKVGRMIRKFRREDANLRI